MASVLITSIADKFPVGTTVEAYEASGFAMNWIPGTAPPAGASSVSSGVVESTGALEVVGLEPGTTYKFYAEVDDGHRYVTGTASKDSDEPLDVDDYEIDGTDTEFDSTGGLQDLFDAAVAEGRKVTLPEGVYRVTGAGLTAPTGLELVLEAGAVLDYSDGDDTGACLTIAGTEDAEIDLSANAAANASSLSVAAGDEAGFAAHDYVRVGSDAQWDPARDDIPVGEITEIGSVAAGALTLKSPLMGGAYNTADAAAVSKINPLRDVQITGPGKIVGNGTTAQKGMVIDRAVNVRVNNVHLEAIGGVGIQVLDSVDVTVDGIMVRRSNVSTGYGVSFVNACQGCLVTNSHFRGCRHSVSINGLTSRRGIGRHIEVSHNHVWDGVAGADQLDTHACCENIAFLYNVVYDATLAGINVECNKVEIIGNRIIRAGGVGIQVLPYSAGEIDVTIRNNRVISAGSDGIKVGTPSASASSTIKSISVTENKVFSAGGLGITIGSTQAWQLTGVVVSDNHVDAAASTTAQILLTKVDSPVFQGNLVTNPPDGTSALRFSTVNNGTVTGNGVRGITSTNRALRFVSCSDMVITGNRAVNVTTGIDIDSGSSNCTVVGNSMRGATTPLSIAGTGHAVRTNGSMEGVTVNATDANSTLTAGTSTEKVVHTATLTADRKVNLATTAWAGATFRVTRTGAGAFNLNVAINGGATLKALVQNTWCEVTHDGTSWVLTAYGAL